MTIREIAEKNRISAQAIYKRLKQAGIPMASLKDKSGKITDEGAKKILEILEPPPPHADPDELNRLTTEVEKLSIEVEKLTTKVEMLTSERDYLRTALEHSQALQGLTLQRVALPQPESGRGLRGRLNAFKHWLKKDGDEHD